MITAVVGGVCFFLGSVTIAPLWIRSGRRAERKLYEDKCPHSWEPWEDCQIGDGWYWQNEKRVKNTKPGQRRDCTMCGERQARVVQVQVKE